MARIWLVAIALLGCGEKKDADPATGDPAGNGTAKPPPVTPKPAAVTADLAMLPIDSDLVIGANVSQLVNSAVWKQLLEPMLATNTFTEKLGELKSRCGGLDPLATVERLTAGVKGLGAEDKPGGVVVVHGLDKAKTVACIESEAKDKAEVTRDGDVTILKTARGDVIAFQFTSDRDAVVVFGPNANGAAVKTAIAGGGALPKTAAFLELFDRVDTAHTGWIVMNGNSKAFDAVAQLGMKPKAMYGSANATDGVTVDMRMKMASASDATKLSNLVNQQVKPMAGMLSFDKLEITPENDDLVLAIGVTAAKLPQLVKQLRTMVEGKLGRTGMTSR